MLIVCLIYNMRHNINKNNRTHKVGSGKPENKDYICVQGHRVFFQTDQSFLSKSNFKINGVCSYILSTMYCGGCMGKTAYLFS